MSQPLKVIGITRVRNEEHTILNTLNHLSGLVAEVYAYDDCSTDRTVEIMKAHHLVKGIIEGQTWDSTPHGRALAEGTLRQHIYELAVRNGADWVYCFDADEYVTFDSVDFSASNCFSFRLFDFYITPNDVSDHYLDRRYMGPEFRDIPMLFKVQEGVKFHGRIPNGIDEAILGGFCKHYGKAISIEEWEATCDYYINHLDEAQPGGTTISNKWRNRKGRAVHERSDFGLNLIEWGDRKDFTKIRDNILGQCEIVPTRRLALLVRKLLRKFFRI